MDSNKNYYIIREDVLPEAVQKTIKIKSALEDDPKLSILEATKKFDLSRSAFYKYKDTIFPVQDFKKESILSMSVNVDDIPGILGKILNIINEEKCSVITIHQTVPISNSATIIFSLNINLELTTIEKLKLKLENLKYVNKVKVIGFSI
ncbi:ACT domain-containing protein [Gemelliphila palaticanis]|uniref:ACT domain-containing protein n=1 Tax=Gemelliphila palaticanis TaxID=81950 RepID=A0ABX2SWS3_9BACL|nr:ACT domain-containing protein [Gemella palaticanis]MBF0714680.1 ACT domain-containing protein [Gemella palaticanis]NYS46610.1 ACT domain-containing protein [Gemella palaticanis]